MYVWGRDCPFDQDSRGGFFDRVTFEQFEKDARKAPDEYLGEEHFKQRG